MPLRNKISLTVDCYGTKIELEHNSRVIHTEESLQLPCAKDYLLLRDLFALVYNAGIEEGKSRCATFRVNKFKRVGVAPDESHETN